MENSGERIRDNRNDDPFPDSPKGVGGWLTFLIVILTVLHPLINIVLLASEFGRVEQENPALLQISAFVQYKWFSWGLVLVCCVVSMSAGYRLWKTRIWKSVKEAVISLWIIGPLATVVLVAYLYINFGTALAGSFVDILGSLFRSLFFAGLWTAYLLRSKRVRNTYSKEETVRSFSGF